MRKKILKHKLLNLFWIFYALICFIGLVEWLTGP